ncbi:MAG TPA: Hsp70 family protein [Pirellulales bacterium]|jgi:molecular chaperone DnaK|nr:Hsp70 family protein [Pirellulales bacterium]
MAEKSTLAVGIDLGTTYSAVAHLDQHGRPVTLVNSEGDLVTPSVVLFEPNNIVVGKEALKAIATEAEFVADCSKRDLGERAYHRVLDGRRYPPEVIQAWILRKLKHDASRLIGDFTSCVITVPAYFDEVRRKATQDAGFMAGLDVIDIINEPTAAAVAFGYQQGFLDARGAAEKPQKLLVYDLGGGTFDVTVMEIAGTDFNALATDGDVRLGGRDWDERIVDLLAEEFIRQHGVDPREDPNVHGRLWRECEDAKRTLSARPKAMITCDYKGFGVRIEVTRQRFDELTYDLLERTSFTTKQALQAAGLQWTDIDRVLMVGGSTRMPMVRDMLRNLSGKEPEAAVSPDEAVAQGAALHAGLVLAKSHGQKSKFSIRNVNSHSLGIVATDPQTQRKRTAVLIPRNTPLPVTAKRIFKTQKKGQKSILVQIVEGESATPDDCTQLGKCVVRDLPETLPAQTPIEVRFRYAENGRLTVSVIVANSANELQHEIARENSLTAEQLNGWRDYISTTVAAMAAAQTGSTLGLS